MSQYTVHTLRDERGKVDLAVSVPSPDFTRDVIHAFFPSPDSFFSASRSLQKKNKAVMRDVQFYRGFPHFLLPN